MTLENSPYFSKQINTTFDLIDEYSFNEPFHVYLKKKFQQNKNWGSKDRKNYRNLSYFILRNYLIFKNLSRKDRIDKFMEIHLNQWVHETFNEFSSLIDASISLQELNESFIQLAPVFFVPFPKVNTSDLQNLPGFLSKIPLTDSFVFQGNTNLDAMILNKLGYVQDYSSTLSIEKISSYCEDAVVWDACCASGGKSLSVLRYSNPFSLYCSDIRSSILENLEVRFKLSPFNQPHVFLFDAYQKSNSIVQFHSIKNNIIIADLPCSGSGNWRRNPENRWKFDVKSLLMYQQKQRLIFESLYKQLPVGGYIYYLTCSIFKAENTENIEYFLKMHSGMNVIFQEYWGGALDDCKGYFSDYIFGCLIQKNQ